MRLRKEIEKDWEDKIEKDWEDKIEKDWEDKIVKLFHCYYCITMKQ